MKTFPSSWNVCPANTVCSEIVDCLNKTAPVVENDTGFRMIRTTNVRNGRVDVNENRFVEEATFIKWTRRARPRRGDIILSREAPLGEVGLLRSDAKVFLGQRTMLYRANSKILDQHFLYYQMMGPYVQAVIHGQGSGSTVAHLRVPDAETLPIPVPPKKAQQNIAAILSAYDELIENNKLRIALLEKMAEEIYREWFVRLRFPGHENVQIIKGVPTNWDVKKISEIVEFLSGYSFKSETYTPSGKLGIVTIKNVQQGHFVPECSDFIDEPPTNMRAHCVLNAGDILMSLTGNVGRVCHVYGSDLLLNQRVAKLQSRLKNGSQFVYCTFNNRSMIQLIENLSLGSTAQMNLSPIQLGKQRLLVPDSALLRRFETAVQPLTKLKINLYDHCERLKIVRDRLLPRLISGRLSVENLDIQSPPGMVEELNADSPTYA